MCHNLSRLGEACQAPFVQVYSVPTLETPNSCPGQRAYEAWVRLILDC